MAIAGLAPSRRATRWPSRFVTAAARLRRCPSPSPRPSPSGSLRGNTKSRSPAIRAARAGSSLIMLAFGRRKSNQRHFRRYPCSVIAVAMPRGTSAKGRKLWGATVPPTSAPIIASSKKNSRAPKGSLDDGPGVEPADAPTTTAQTATNGLTALEPECSKSQLATGYNVRTSRKSNQGLACHRRLESARDSTAPTTSPAPT